MKVVSILLILVGLAAMGAGIASAPSHAAAAAKLPAVAMREIGAVPPGSVVAEKAAPAPAPAAAAKAEPAPERGNGKALEKALEKTAEKPSDDLAVPEKPAEKSRPPPAEKPAPERTAERAPAPAERAAPPPAKNTGSARAPAADKGVTANPYDDTPAPAPAASAGATNGVLNLRASDTADVFVDGRKVGSSPLLGLKVKPGKHKVRFDCYQPSGETKPGPTQSYDVTADAEKEVDYECPSE